LGSVLKTETKIYFVLNTNWVRSCHFRETLTSPAIASFPSTASSGSPFAQNWRLKKLTTFTEMVRIGFRPGHDPFFSIHWWLRSCQNQVPRLNPGGSFLTVTALREPLHHAGDIPCTKAEPGYQVTRIEATMGL